MNKNKNEKSEFETFLTDTDEVEEGVEYIHPDIELKLPIKQRNECREIVQEIKSFGVRSQRQILYIIYLLSLEIEDINTMKLITSACKTGRKDLGEEKNLIISKL